MSNPHEFDYQSLTTGSDVTATEGLWRFVSRAAFVALALGGIAMSLPKVAATDWPNIRGPELNGTSPDVGLPESWSPKGENLLWRNEAWGSRCTPIVMNNRIYTICRAFPETTQEGEKTVCIDLETGNLLWESIHNIYLSDAPAERIGWSSVVGDPESGNVYVLGLGCVFQCLNGKTGEILWQRSMSEEYGMLSTYGGRTNFPMVFDDLVIISGVTTGWGETAVPAHRFFAFDKRTGAAVWSNTTRPRPEDTTYSFPVLTTFNGQAAMVVCAGDGAVYAFQPRTGKQIWKYQASNRGINTPALVVDNRVYAGHSEQNAHADNILGAVFALDGLATGEIAHDQLKWHIPKLTVGRSAPLMVDGRLYFIEDGAVLVVVDPETGEMIGEKKLGRIMFGSAVYGDGKIYVGEATGRFYILKPSEKGVDVLSHTRLNNEEILGSPIIANGKVILPSTGAMYCIGTSTASGTSEAKPAYLPERPVAADTTVAHIQIVPSEVLVAPGSKTKFQVRAYNSFGQIVASPNVQYSLDGVGAIDASGTLTLPPGKEHRFLAVTAKAGELTSVARARVIPPLPWEFDFSDKKVPITWIGAAYRHQPKELDGESLLVKVSTIPKGTRSQSWMGWTGLHDYTIQADVYSTTVDNQQASMGLVNQRYTLDLMAGGKLQIRSWTPRLELRFAKTIDFQWEPLKWYTLKFQSENKEGKAILRGKVWERGTPEPMEWSIEAADGTPNVVGSPGVFGNSSPAEFYIDNVRVYENPKS